MCFQIHCFANKWAQHIFLDFPSQLLYEKGWAIGHIKSVYSQEQEITTFIFYLDSEFSPNTKPLHDEPWWAPETEPSFPMTACQKGLIIYFSTKEADNCSGNYPLYFIQLRRSGCLGPLRKYKTLPSPTS